MIKGLQFKDCISVKDYMIMGYDKLGLYDKGLQFKDCISVKDYIIMGYNKLRLYDKGMQLRDCISVKEYRIKEYNKDCIIKGYNKDSGSCSSLQINLICILYLR